MTAQHDSTDASYVPPKGLEVLLPPPAPEAAKFLTLKIGNGQPSGAELKHHVQRDKPVVLQVDGKASFGDVVHAIDVCRAAGAKVVLATPEK